MVRCHDITESTTAQLPCFPEPEKTLRTVLEQNICTMWHSWEHMLLVCVWQEFWITWLWKCPHTLSFPPTPGQVWFGHGFLGGRPFWKPVLSGSGSDVNCCAWTFHSSIPFEVLKYFIFALEHANTLAPSSVFLSLPSYVSVRRLHDNNPSLHFNHHRVNSFRYWKWRSRTRPVLFSLNKSCYSKTPSRHTGIWRLRTRRRLPGASLLQSWYVGKDLVILRCVNVRGFSAGRTTRTVRYNDSSA